MNLKPLTFIGLNTLPIMCFHKIINTILRHYISYNAAIYIIIGLLFSLSLGVLLAKNRIACIMFLGKYPNTKK